MAANKSSRHGVRFREPVFLPPLNTQSFSSLATTQSKNLSILALSQRQMTSKGTNTNPSLHKYMSQSSIPPPTNLPHHDITTNVARHDMDFISNHKDFDQPNNKTSYPSSRRHHIHPLQHRQSSKPKRPLHRYSSLPIQPIRETDDRSVDDSLDVFGQSINGRLQKIHQQNPRSIHSRFELIEDRFLTNTISNTDVPSPRLRPTFVSQPSLSKSYPSKEVVFGESGSIDTIEHAYTDPYYTSNVEIQKYTTTTTTLPICTPSTPCSKKPKSHFGSDPSRQTSSPKVRLSASFKKTSSQSSRTGPYSQGIRGISLHRLPNFADKLRGYGYVFGKTLGTRRRYSENLQKLKARLKKSRSQGDFGPRLFMPKVRFRKAVRLIILLLRAIFTTRERIQRQEKERKLSMCLNLSDPHMTSKRAYETYGISFDPLDFKANRQIQVTPEARSVLSMDPSERTPQQLRAVLVSLRQAVPEFSEFPINMQQSLARVGRYERFSAKRVIIRQGHLADNFYFILSGTAVVILLEIDKVTEEQKARTAAVLGRGKSFGELALMHKARRSATVTCRDDVELLSVGREDFVDIFMHVDRGVEPEHIRFLKKLPMLRGWPLHVLPNDNPKVLLFTYVRRGVVLCRDSNSSEWIFIIKSGSCRIIKALAALPANKIKRATPASTKPRVNTPIRPRSCHTSKSLTRIEEESSITDDDRSSFYSGDTDDRDLRLSGGRRDRASSAHGRRDDDDKKSGLQYIQSLDAIIDQKHQYNADSNDEPEKDLQEELNSERSTKPCIFVQVLKLGPKDIYGLESSVFNNMKKTVSTSLVSDGAEMIMIKRKFFMDNTSSELKKRMIKEIHPLPTEESLQNQLQNRVEWESYRTLTLQKTMADMRLIETHSPRR